MKETKTFVMSQLTALHEEMRIYSAAIHAHSIGKIEEAKATVCVFGEDRAGKTRDTYTQDVSKRARSRVKARSRVRAALCK